MSRVHFKAVEVRGESMSPNYNDGDWLLFRLLPAKSKSSSKAKALVGKVVLIQRRSQVGKDFLQVKRVTKITSEANIGNEIKFWVEGDNATNSTDSRSWGALNYEEVIGRLIFRYKKS